MRLRVVSADPFNAEPPLTALGEPVTPVEDFYVRSNFPAPDLDATRWRLRVHGRVHTPVELDLERLQAMPRWTTRVTLECAGNGRQLMNPTPPGTAWALGAAGTANFTGVALRDVLALADPHDDAAEVVFTGADSGSVAGKGATAFQRSLALEHATSDEPLVAWAMNGAPLTRDHGFPVRLIVPRFYAVASVKWLVDVEVVDRPFRGHFQADRYVYRAPGAADQPVTTMRVRSLITSHADGTQVASGEVTLQGMAWSGDAEITRVQIRHGPDAWLDADVGSGGDPDVGVGVMTPWRCVCHLAPGEHELLVRATDATGATQPLTSGWNELGYGNNVVHVIRLRAV
jgi:DMSO/TMAO reductase YedYZ molybdopterin-dependent catalytic subunit